MMVQRKIDIVLIGFVFACMPVIMQLGRMFFATFSDFWGRKPFFILNGLLGIVSGLIYYFAHTALEFLFGKVAEGTKEGTLWAVNRAFLLERSPDQLRILVYMRTVIYVAYAFGSLLAGFLISWLLFEGTMILCALSGIFVLLLSLFLANERKEHFSVAKALQFLDIRKRGRVFKIFLFLFFCMGLAFGFIGGFVIPVFLSAANFNAENIGLIVCLQIVSAGLSSYIFSRTTKIRSLVLLSGMLFSTVLILLGF